MDYRFDSCCFCQLDWLGFTFRPVLEQGESIIGNFLKFFPEFNFDDFVEAPGKVRRDYRYMNCYFFHDLVISYDSIDEEDTPSSFDRKISKGVNVQVSSEQLEYFCSLLNIDYTCSNAVAVLLKELCDRHCTFSRIDLCWDDYNKIFTPDYYARAYYCGYLQTPFECSAIKNETFYVGSLKSRVKLLRIYDKSIESHGVFDCIRYEFEYHKDNAQDVGLDIINRWADGVPFPDLLYRWLKVKDKSKLDNYSRLYDVPDDPEWFEALIKDLTLSYPLIIPHYESCYSDTELTRWLTEKALSSLAGYVKCFGKTSLLSMIRIAIKKDKINPRYESFYRKLKASNELFYDDSILDNEFY